MKFIKRLENRVLRFVGVLSRSISSRGDIKYKEFNMQKGQHMFLTRICENPEINFIDLSNLLKVDKTTATKAVKKLIEIGYVNKEQDGSDKRGCKLTATKKGLEIYNLLIEEENRQIKICFKDFSEEEKQMANKLLNRMSKNIEEYWIEAKNKVLKE